MHYIPLRLFECFSHSWIGRSISSILIAGNPRFTTPVCENVLKDCQMVQQADRHHITNLQMIMSANFVSFRPTLPFLPFQLTCAATSLEST